jgi:3-deoxy-manno-octulosonate cytidylyltransferase (CMP-KDO synthetase)
MLSAMRFPSCAMTRERAIKRAAPFRVVIPARYASQRLPGKPLLDIGGKPMIQRVYERALASGADQVLIATDDARIAEAVAAFTRDVRMTSTDHVSGTDRIAEVAEAENWPPDTIVVNLQGDEPLMPSQLLQQVAKTLVDHPLAEVATLSVPITQTDQLFDPNTVKVVCDKDGYALYFSRASIPWKRDVFDPEGQVKEEWLTGMQRHLGIYAYRAGFLTGYAKLSAAPVEQMESLEQLRALWHGKRIAVSTASVEPPPGVDTEHDLEKVRAAIAQTV